jgi:hypothetical protein
LTISCHHCFTWPSFEGPLTHHFIQHDAGRYRNVQ